MSVIMRAPSTLTYCTLIVCALSGAVGADPLPPAGKENTLDTSPENAVHINQLIHETSPYLLQHAHNPVDWYPWGDEAIERARAENKPIFLSIGYSACHWCHVMAHESFESEAIAAILNDHFVSIKVDREERPDLDEIYMTAVIGLTGQGGWPMSVWLTPELKPFYGGTYYPPHSGYGRPGFGDLLRNIAQAWESQEDEVRKSAEGLHQFITAQLAATPTETGTVSEDVLKNAFHQVVRTFDPGDGGWGQAPKFPSSHTIGFLLRHFARTGDGEALRQATETLDKMAYGGLYDQLGGGFHRYSVDAEWLVPHFEKMLYDNGQLSQVYLEAYQLTGNPLYRRIVEDTLDYVLRDLRDERGGFHSAEDADSEGEEGKFYLWSHTELVDLLGEEDAKVFCAYYAISPGGNFSSHEPYHDNLNIPHVPRAPEAVAESLGMTVADLEARLAPMRVKLMEVRSQRVRPGLDDKVLTSWNALMISGFAQAGRVLNNAKYVTAAQEAGQFLLDHMTRDGGLLRTHRHGESRLPGYLDDYAFTVCAFVDLYESTFDVKWLKEADRIAEEMIARFWDDAAGTFFFTGSEHKDLLVRTRPTYDGAEASGNSMAALGLLRLARLRDKGDYHKKAKRLLAGNAERLQSTPQGYLRMLWAADLFLHPPHEIAVVGPEDDSTRALLDIIDKHYLPNKVLAVLDPGSAGAAEASETIPLLAEKTAQGGAATVYVCRDFVCDQPLTDPKSLNEKLSGLHATP
jgi:hypothetical protein